jgi:Uma2 family endonuclease
MAERVVLNYADYAALPDDGRRYELHDGELSVTPAPGVSHQAISGKLHLLLAPHAERSARGIVLYAPCDVILDRAGETTVVQPDLVYLRAADRDRLSERGIEGPPTLAIEILSPFSRLIDRRTKLRLYEKYAVPYYWIVDPGTRTIEAYELRDDAYRLALTASGKEPVTVPPFPDLAIIPEAVFTSPV